MSKKYIFVHKKYTFAHKKYIFLHKKYVKTQDAQEKKNNKNMQNI